MIRKETLWLDDDDSPSQMLLPFWTDTVRAVPKAAVYSALFAPLMRGKRDQVKRREMSAIGQYQLIYTGERLDQTDLDVFLWLLHQNRTKSADRPIEFSANAMLRELGLTKSGGNRYTLLQTLTRLQACSVEVKFGKLAYSGALVSELYRDDEAKVYKARLNPKLAGLMDPQDFGGYAQVHWAQRRKLGTKGLARWLHAFVSNMSRPLTFAVDALHDLAGGQYSRMRDFRAKLDRAAKDVRDAGCPLHIDWSADSTKITLSLRPTQLPKRG